jgi:hypothetical protein
MKIDRLSDFILFIASTVMLSLAACDSDSCLHGTGQESSLRIETGHFEALNVQGIFRIILVQDTTCYVEFQGGDKVLEYVNATNTESTVWLDNTNQCFFFRDYEKIKAYVHFSHLNRIDLFEVSRVESLGAVDSIRSMTVQGPMADIDIELNCDQFSFYNNHTTGGRYTFSGMCNKFSISAYYTAQITTDRLVAKNIFINNSSLSDIYITAEDLLRVEIHNRGNIYYAGSPQIEIDSVSGSGKLIPWDNTENN